MKDYFIYSFSKTEALIEALEETVPDAILLDHHAKTIMGDTTLCRELKVRHAFPNKIFLLSTVDIPKAQLNECLADGIIPKPFDLREVYQTVKNALL